MSFELGVRDALAKVASLDGTVHDVVSTALKAHLEPGVAPGPDDDLDTLLPGDGHLEAVIQTVEENFDVHLPTDTVFNIFAHGSVSDLEKAVVKQLVVKGPEKVAAADSHAYYMRNRARIQQKQRAYRLRNLHQIRRRAKIYRRKVKRKAIRPRKRIGARGAGYTFIPR